MLSEDQRDLLLSETDPRDDEEVIEDESENAGNGGENDGERGMDWEPLTEELHGDSGFVDAIKDVVGERYALLR